MRALNINPDTKEEEYVTSIHVISTIKLFSFYEPTNNVN